MFLNISGAGLVALFFALVISPVLSIPIPLPSQSGLSSRNEQVLIYRGSAAGRIRPQTPLLNGPISTATEAFSDNTADGPQLVRRNSKLNAKIRAAFHSFGQKIKQGFQKVGQKIKQGFQTFGKKVKQGFQIAGQKIKQGFQTAGQKIKQGFQTAGTKIKQGFQTAGTKIKQGFQTFAKKAKQGFQKVGTFLKTTGAKIAKFGLKVVQTLYTVAGKIVSWIPAVGKPIDRALEGVSKLAGLASDKIHANLGKKLEKGMKVMNTMNKVMDYVPRRRDLSEGSVQQLEIGDEERDEIALEDREESDEQDTYEHYLDLE
jgi:hypothetical protein